MGKRFAVLAALAALAPAQARSHDTVVTVWGERTPAIGSAMAASQGSVGFAGFADRPLLRVGELVEVAPGVAATQHSGTGKANQYFLRGFNLDHGTDFSASIDGMPLNLRTNAHGQGYLDLNPLIPEVIARIDYRKGTADAAAGDFSAAGSVAFRSFAALPENFAAIELGEDQRRRIVAGVEFGRAGYAALDLTTDDGPWVDPEDLRKFNGFARIAAGPVLVSAGAYAAEWNAADQIPLRAVRDGRIDRLEDIDADVGGESERYWLTANYAAASGLRATGYVMRHRMELFSNFTYFLDDPENGDEFEQSEERWVFGGSVRQRFRQRGAWRPSLAAEVRLDRIDPIGLYRTTGRARRETVREDALDQDSLAAWVDLAGAFGRLRTDFALRADVMRAEVDAGDPRNAGTAEDWLLSPKAALAYRFGRAWEGYATTGRGFHSNDARGATIRFDPASGEPVDRVELFAAADGAELGLRYEEGDVSANLTTFWLDLESELVYVGDAGATEAAPASRRIGLEAAATWAPTDWLTLEAAYAATRARLRDAGPGGDRIPLANEYVATAGLTLRPTEHWTAALTVRRLGPAALIEDASVKSDPSTVVNGRLAWRSGRLTLAADVLNLLDSEDADITYFYASRLPGEPEAGVEDIHFHPIPPRSVRVQARTAF